MPRLVRSLILAGLVLAVASTDAASAGRVDPRLRFRWTRTPHFTIYFHEGSAAMAARLAPIAEETWAELPMRLGLTLPAHTHVVLADQADTANAWAFPLPFNTVLIHTSIPSGADRIGRTTDWLRVVFTHEFAHIVHLDQSEGWARGLRRVFGRMPLAFPNLFLPAWMIEGLATYEESAVTGEGRLGAGDFRAIEREAARADRFLPLDGVNGGLVAWPAGEAPYAYGLGFHELLADRAGESSLGDVARRTAGRLPFLGTPAFEDVYGEPLGSLWRRYRQVVADGVRAAADQKDQKDQTVEAGRGVTRITTTGYAVTGPRFLGPACPGCSPEILYTMETPHAFPSLEVAALDGTHRRLATRFRGRTVGVSRDWVVFDQAEIRRNAGLYNDLYVLSRSTGEVRALSTEGRYADPDLAPDGRSIVCVREGNGQRDLVVLSLEGDPPVRLGAPRVVLAAPETVFNAPRWSPDGRRVAVERHRRGGWPEVVVVDVMSGEVEHVARMREARVVTPAWRSDGSAVVAAADAAGRPFDLWEFPLTGARAAHRLTSIPGGALWPDVSADGSRITFVSATADGLDVHVTPYAPTDDTRAFDGDVRPDIEPATAAIDPRAVEAGSTRRYRPWSTLRPTSWMPTLDDDGRRLRLGALVSGTDVLAYHRYNASIGWVVRAPQSSRRGPPVPDWRFEYAYDRWRPTYFGSLSSERRFVTASSGPLRLRRDEAEAGVLLPFRGVRRSQSGAASVAHTTDRIEDGQPFERDQERVALRAGWSVSTARRYGYSVSLEDGIQAAVTAEGVVSATDRPRTTSVSFDVRRYMRGVARHHVAAVRLAGGAMSEESDQSEWFFLGGAGGAGTVDPLETRPFGLLRGFAVDRFTGTRLTAATVEYRWPLVWPERGIGTWPAFLSSLQAAVFADVGHAWTGRLRPADAKWSVGGELGTSIVFGYGLPLTVTVGAGAGRDGQREGVPASRTAYVRLGSAF